LRQIFRDAGHLIRPAVVLIAALGVFLLVRTAFIPKAFGKYGHYDPASLEVIRRRPMAYAGHETCEMCHDEVAKAHTAGNHAHVACETCHGPQAAHANADDPGSHKPQLPDVANLCRRCHEKDAAKPKTFPQVATAEHSGGALCTACHQPHNPHL
jgi:hypothetical protein